MNKLKERFQKIIPAEKLMVFIYGVLIALLAYFSLSSYIHPFSKDGFDGFAFEELTGGWVQALPDGTERAIPSLPADLDDKLGEEIVIRRQLPEVFPVEGPVLMVKSRHQLLTARINGEEFFRYDYQASQRYDANFPPSLWIAIPLSADCAGATVELSLIRLQDDWTDTVSSIFLGDKGDIVFKLLRQHLFPILCAAATLLTGAFFLVRQLIWMSYKELERRSLYVGIILLLLSIWLLCNSDARQFFFDNILYVRNMEFLTILMLPIPVVLSVNYSERGRFQDAAYALCLVIFLIDLVIMGLMLTGVRNLLSLLWLIMVTIGMAALFIVISFCAVARTDAELFRSLRIALFSYGSLTLFGIGEYLDLVLLADRHQGICLSIGILCYAVGLTAEQSRDQRLLVAQVQRSKLESRAKSDFLASMSHEIRTPINAVLGMDEMILREAKDPVVLDYAADIRHAGRHLLSLIDEILDISRIESGRMEISEDDYDLEALLADITELIRVQAQEKGLAFETRVLSVIPNKLRGDAPRIRQIAINLLNNSVKYTRSGRIVFSVDAISAEEARVLRSEALVQGPPADIENPVYLRLNIRDTGIGMHQEDIPTIFDSFRRLDPEENAGIQGTGLGLPIVSTLIQLMHGFLLVKSVYGIGSQFTVVLPQAEISSDRFGSFAGRQDAAPDAGGGALFRAPEAKVLAVDDNALNRRLLKALLRRTQVQLTVCESGKECLELAGGERYDLILMDHLMPEMDGIETLHRLRALPDGKCGDVPVIVLTANAVAGVREDYLAKGFNDYLSKPIRSAELESMMMRYLPPEKVLAPEAEDGSDAGAEAPLLPEWLRGVEELDVPLGLRYCGTADVYLDTLAIYAKNAAPFADEIEACRRADDVSGAVVKIHALKSTSLAVGAAAISKLAGQLEAAGKAGDVQTLDAELGGLLARCRSLGEALAPLAAEEEAAPGALSPISDAELRDTYDAIRVLLSQFEFDRVSSMIASLAASQLPEEERERCERLRRAADNFEWDQLETILP